jgi:transposase, IS30 family
LAERSQIDYFLKLKKSIREIGRLLKRAVSSISDEIKINLVNGKYDAKKAHHKAYVRRRESKYQGMKIVQNDQLRDKVDELLYDDQSPEAIAGRITKHEKGLSPISGDSIRRYIKSPYGRNIENHRNRRKGKRRHRSRKGKLRDRRFIEERPISLQNRRRVGDAEGDFIVSGKSGKGILLVIVDRKFRLPFLEIILQPSLDAITRACLRIKKRYPEWKTMTTDNDLLFAHHKKLEKILGIKIYFCHPYHAWEKGEVENINGVIRHDIPKSSDISRYSKHFIKKLEAKLQRKIYECLDHLTPAEKMKRYRKRKTALSRRLKR